jgi:hypothetical protein
MANPVYVAKVEAQGTSSNVSTYTSRNCSPLPNRLLIACVRNRKTNSTDPEVPTLTGCGVTWDQVTTVIAGSGATRSRLTVFRAYSSAAISGFLTATFGGVAQNSVNVMVVDCSQSDDTGGSNGSNALVQAVTNSGNGTTASVTLGAFGDSDNAAVSFSVKNSSGAVTPGTGWTELSEQTFATTVLHAQWRKDNDTSADCSWTGAADWASVAIEIKAGSDLPVPTELLTDGLATQLGDPTGSALYVSYLNGNDTTGDGTTGNPYKTLDKALEIVGALGGASSIIRLKYDGGSPHQPLSGERTIVGQVNSTIQVQGKSISEPVMIETDPADDPDPLTRTNLAVFTGEIVVGDLSNRVTSNIRIRNLKVTKLTAHESATGAYGIRVGAARNVEIEGCELTDNNQGGIQVTGGVSACENVLVHHNWIHDTGSFGASHNANYNHDHGIYWGGQNPGVYGGAIWNNIFYGFPYGRAIQLYADGSGGFQSSRSCVVAYNTCYDVGINEAAADAGWIISLGGVGAGSEGAINNVVTSNLLVKNTEAFESRSAVLFTTLGSGNLVKYNLAFDIQDPTTFETDAMATLSNNIDEEDPLFADPDNQDFHLDSASPAAGAGEAAYLPADDFYGDARSTSDIGAVNADEPPASGSAPSVRRMGLRVGLGV